MSVTSARRWYEITKSLVSVLVYALAIVLRIGVGLLLLTAMIGIFWSLYGYPGILILTGIFAFPLIVSSILARIRQYWDYTETVAIIRSVIELTLEGIFRLLWFAAVWLIVLVVVIWLVKTIWYAV